MNSFAKTVYIIILTWNHLQDTIECLESVFKSNYPSFHVVIVDNASTDNTLQTISEKYPNVFIIPNPDNYGYAEGNNVGIRYAQSNNADYIFVLNNDTVIQADSISCLVDELEKCPDTIAASPISYYYDQPEKIYFAGGVISPEGKVGHATSIKEQVGYETEWLNGCALMMRAKFLSEVGLFNPEYFLLFEDTDWSLRAIRSGFCLRIVPEATILHKASTSFQGPNSAKQIYYYLRNYHLFYKNNYPANIRFSFHLNRIKKDLRSVKKTVKILLGKDPKNRAIRLAYFDYFLRRFHRRDYQF